MTLNTEHVINSRGTHSPLTIDYSLYSIDLSPSGRKRTLISCREKMAINSTSLLLVAC